MGAETLESAFAWILSFANANNLWGEWESIDPDVTFSNDLVTSEDCTRVVLKQSNTGPFANLKGACKTLLGRRLTITLDTAKLGLVLQLSNDDPWVRQPQALSDLHAHLNKSLSSIPSHWVCSQAAVTISGLAIPRLRPMRQMGVHLIQSIVQVYMDVALAKRLRQASRPPGFQLSATDDHTILRVAEDLVDQQYLRQQLVEKQRWLQEIFNFRIAPGYNNLGDARHNLIGFKPHSDTTLYSTSARQAAQTVVLDQQGEPEAYAWQAVNRLATHQSLDSGERVAKIYLIAPSREEALVLRTFASQLANNVPTKVLYASDHGTIWDPFPPGDWVEAS